jgi:hypothetical protein
VPTNINHDLCLNFNQEIHIDSLGGETFSDEEQQDPVEQSLGDSEMFDDGMEVVDLTTRYIEEGLLGKGGLVRLSSLPIHVLDAIAALTVFCGVGRGTTARVSLVPLFAFGMRLMTVTPSMGFGWFVSWISSVAILDPCPPSYLPTNICHWSPAGVV